MTTFPQFAARCKMRHDFDDQIQVRYRHTDGQDYDTWVSGLEAEHRLASQAKEQHLKSTIRHLNRQQVETAGRQLPAEGQKRLRDRLQQSLADGLEELIGGNVIGEALTGRVRGQESSPQPDPKQKWSGLLQEQPFRSQILDMAWINLRGSFPDTDEAQEVDDWL